ncbi:MAG: DUF1002 domain-containing protein [Eubacteriales bacterium]
MKVKNCIIVLVMLFVMVFPSVALADVAAGDAIVSLGEDLTDAQEVALLEEFNAPEDAQRVYVKNEEEHQYLGDYIPSSRIGNKAISSAIIRYTEEGSGITVETKNINYITEEIYTNALTTAGVEDADIMISAPYSVSGTAALTGIIKAYEESTDQIISEDIKQFANEEMVTTAELGEEIGQENAADIIAVIKNEIAKKNPKTEEEIQEIITNVTNNYNIELTQDQKDALLALFNKMKNLDINWNHLSSQIQNLSEKAKDYINSEEGQSFLANIGKVIKGFFEWLGSLF